ncbi:hypothetical protein B0O99DRAFT_733954, partial [Bisporella sp. PMI_857]
YQVSQIQSSNFFILEPTLSLPFISKRKVIPVNMGEKTLVDMDKTDYNVLEPGECFRAEQLNGCTILAVSMEGDMGFMAHFASLTLNGDNGPKLVTEVGETLNGLLGECLHKSTWLIVSADRGGERFSTGNNLIREWLTGKGIQPVEMRYRTDQGSDHIVELGHGEHGLEITAPTSIIVTQVH